MTGYLTVGLILCLGGYFALLLVCRTREQGVVVAEHPFLRYFRALASATVAAVEEMARLAVVIERAARSLTSEVREVLGLEDIEVVFDDRPLLSPLRVAQATKERVCETPEHLFAGRSGEHVDYTLGRHLSTPCANCGELPAAHTAELGFGLVCPIDSGARTENERFTYTRPGDWIA